MWSLHSVYPLEMGSVLTVAFHRIRHDQFILSFVCFIIHIRIYNAYVFHTENSVLLQTYLSCMFLRLLLLFRWFCWARNLVLQNICWFLRTKQRIRKTVEYSYCLAALAINKTSVKAIELNLTKSIVLLVRFAVFFIMLLLFDSYLWCWCYWFAVDVIFFLLNRLYLRFSIFLNHNFDLCAFSFFWCTIFCEFLRLRHFQHIFIKNLCRNLQY